MKLNPRALLILFVLLVVAGGIYATGVYTYFLNHDVQEAVPQNGSMLVQGEFGKIDAIHSGSGTAMLIEKDGKTTLRFENFEVTNGPDLHVYITKSSKPTNDLASLGDYLDLGVLKGNSGNQNYELPLGAHDYRTAVIWCKRFGVLFSYAHMQ